MYVSDMPDYIFTARNIVDNKYFGDTPDEVTHYIILPDNTSNDITTDYEVSQKQWLLSVIASDDAEQKTKDLLIIVHGYNVSTVDMLESHRTIKTGLVRSGFKGKVISFDWPSSNSAIMYLPDRHKAKKTAMQLVKGGIALLVQQQQNNCTINVHVLAHSTGAYVVRMAFDDADDTNEVQIPDNKNSISVNSSGWMVTQMMFIEGDISSSSLGVDSDGTAIHKHTVRLTNYFNPYDKVLALSNVKRMGFENRVGRVGLPVNAPPNCVDVNCGPYYQTIEKFADNISYSHSWYFDSGHNQIFIKDLLYTINGDIDRNYIPTRRNQNGSLILVE